MYMWIGLSAILALLTTSSADCFFPNGNVVPSDTACNPNAIVSACCFDGQACLSNGLCVSDPHNETLARLHRGTCTDQQWKSGNCPRQCLDVDDNGAPVYSCNQTNTESYCCYDGCQCNPAYSTFSIAMAPQEVYTVTIIGEDFTQTRPTATSSTPSPSTSASAATTDSGATVPASSTTSPVAEQSTPNTTAIGAGVGVGVPVAALLAVVAFFWWKRRQPGDPTPSTSHSAKPYEPSMSQNSPVEPDLEKYAYYTSEKSSRSLPSSELPATPMDPVELPTSPPPKKTAFGR
ncbi:hypothetical protein EJ04DRAFT_541325 [Polyplosphaeria fusca]|uniref:Uncharacterized protein n=1 Tax=Polyplosphaeria fusca TaxID=682080 RepID=A0A9P4V3D0_9PLEO|nr:hypothetical protein EJ04DRAFT_541325 [Polyplosphaeria fusca]